MPALVSSSFFSTVMSAPIAEEEEEVLPPEAEAAEAAALRALKSEAILLTALLDLPDLPAPKAAAIRPSAAAAVTGLASTVRDLPALPPGKVGVVVLPSAPKASATMTLSLKSPG